MDRQLLEKGCWSVTRYHRLETRRTPLLSLHCRTMLSTAGCEGVRAQEIRGGAVAIGSWCRQALFLRLACWSATQQSFPAAHCVWVGHSRRRSTDAATRPCPLPTAQAAMSSTTHQTSTGHGAVSAQQQKQQRGGAGELWRNGCQIKLGGDTTRPHRLRPTPSPPRNRLRSKITAAAPSTECCYRHTTVWYYSTYRTVLSALQVVAVQRYIDHGGSVEAEHAIGSASPLRLSCHDPLLHARSGETSACSAA